MLTFAALFETRVASREVVAEQTFVVQLSGDWGVYLPTAKAVAGGHYGTMITDNCVGPEGGDILVDRTVELINGMWDDDAQ